MGPEGRPGWEDHCYGYAEQVARNAQSHTGRFLAKALRMEMARRSAPATTAAATGDGTAGARPKAAIQLRGSLNAETLRAKVGLHVSRFTFTVTPSAFPAAVSSKRRTPPANPHKAKFRKFKSLERLLDEAQARSTQKKQFRGGHRALQKFLAEKSDVASRISACIA